MEHRPCILFFLILLLPAFFPAGSILAQENLLRGELFAIKDGLSQTHVNLVYQDSIGFLWIGTRDGLNKYDGYTFNNYLNLPFDTSSISNNYIRAFAEDAEGNLWIGTNGGLNKMDRITGTFEDFVPPAGNDSPLTDPAVYSVCIDSGNKIWLKTWEDLMFLDPATAEFKVVDLHYDRLTNITGERVMKMLIDNSGLLWISTKDGLQTCNTHTLEVKRIVHDPDDVHSISSNRVRCIYKDHTGRLWIGTEYGLNIFDPETNRFKRFIPDELKGTRSMIINDICEDTEGIFWIATEMGFFRMTAEGTMLEYHNNLLTGNTYQQISAVYSIIEDHSRIIWMGTYDGLVKIDRKPLKFGIINNSKENIPGLSGNIISSVYEDSEGLLWLGTWGFGLNIADRQKRSAIHYSSKNNSRSYRWICNDYIFSIYKDKAGQVWVGTSDGLMQYQKATGRMKNFCEGKENISFQAFQKNTIYSILEDRRGDIWFATSNGIHRYGKTFGELKSFYTIFSGESNFEINSAYCLLEDKEGFLWIGTMNGLIRYNPETGEFRIFQQKDSDDHTGPGSNTIYSLYQDLEDNLWVGTASGLNRMDVSTETFKYYDNAEGYSSNHIYAILEDGNSYLWLSTNRGLFRFDPLREIFVGFDLADGMQDYEFIPGSAYKSHTGEFFFGGRSGINYFFPDSIPFNEYMPALSFTNFEIDGEFGRKSYPLDRALHIMLLWNRKFSPLLTRNRSFSIGFAALDFTASGQNRYKYMMVKKGSDGLWVNIGNQHHVTFYNLSPGNYTFSFKGSNNDNIWNEDAASIQVRVQPPIWISWKAYVVYGSALIVIIYILIQYRTRNLRRSNRMLREKEAAAREIDKQREELVMKNKNITDSIDYAKRIQLALLPSDELFKKLLPDSFILFKPKDIVSGDFYWINRHQHKVYVAAVDCTGHGVPGAFVSIIGFELFRKLTSGNIIRNSADILNSLNENFNEIFSDGEHVYLNDGMDLSLCVIDEKENYLEYSGAFNPLYLVRDETIVEIKADRFSIGADVHVSSLNQSFKSHRIDLGEGDILYMFSDGFADQFGGPEGKKFKYRRFRHLLLTIHKLPLDKQQAILDASIEEWKGNFEQVDDIMVIGIRPDFTANSIV